MKTKPILFSTPMVKAILEGKKTQTRRVIQFELNNIHYVFGMPKENIKLLADWSLSGIDEFRDNILSYYVQCDVDDSYSKEIKCPYEIGQILWVRETFCPVVDAHTFEDTGFKYRADNNTQHYNGCWKPSIFMPKVAARIFLKVTNVRIERLHDITESDAIDEGIKCIDNVYYDYLSEKFYRKPYESFCTLWTKINGKESWNKNPFVWVYEFERIEKPKNFI